MFFTTTCNYLYYNGKTGIIWLFRFLFKQTSNEYKFYRHRVTQILDRMDGGNEADNEGDTSGKLSYLNVYYHKWVVLYVDGGTCHKMSWS